MGIAYGALRFLMEEGKREPWAGSILTLGRQDIGVLETDVIKLARSLSFPLVDIDTGLLNETHRSHCRFIDDNSFFKSLGFETVNALDVSPYQGADVLHDLNSKSIPDGCREKFDLVLDGGTLEHVFDICSALRSVCEMTKVGGRIIHISPMSNCADHGFYSFSPTLFADFYSTNGFAINRLTVSRFEKDPVNDEWEYIEYHPDDFGTLGALSPGTYFVMACVRRLSTSSANCVPQQGFYRTSVLNKRMSK